jgi:hypothetical protein
MAIKRNAKARKKIVIAPLGVTSPTIIKQIRLCSHKREAEMLFLLFRLLLNNMKHY